MNTCVSVWPVEVKGHVGLRAASDVWWTEESFSLMGRFMGHISLSLFLSLTLSFDSLGYKSSTNTTFFELHSYLYLQLTGTLTSLKFQRSTDWFHPHYLPHSLCLPLSLSFSLSLSDGFSPSCRSMLLGSVERCQPSQGTQREKCWKMKIFPFLDGNCVWLPFLSYLQELWSACSQSLCLILGLV